MRPTSPLSFFFFFVSQGVLEEVQLIEWPNPKQAVLNTLLVIGIVGGTSALLFAVNTGLTELSRVVYK
jgi:preprotein translocase SecE subunit